MFARRPTADQVLDGQDLAGKVYAVTGADSGIGYETARALAARGARVWVGGLRHETVEAAIGRMEAAHPGATLRPWVFDLGSLAAVAEAARTFPEPLDGLVCNAGVYGGPYARTVDGFERTLGVCHVGHAALALGLLDRLGAGSRVVWVSSENHRWPGTLDFDAFPIGADGYTELAAYGQAKLCIVAFARAFDERFVARGVRGVSLHPGNLVATGIDQDSWVLRTVMALARPFSPTPSQAAATSVWLATTDAIDALGGGYYVDRQARTPAAPALDRAVRDRLWDLTIGWVGPAVGFPPP